MLNIYIEEANELLTKLESCLLELTENSNQKVQIEEIFRIMHTLKGNSSMFGLDKVAQFIHNLESLYDNIRSGKQQLSKQIIDITFKSLDHIKNIINDPKLNLEKNLENNRQYTKTILWLIVSEKKENKPPPPHESVNDESGFNTSTYYILFYPKAQFFKNGANPLLTINELSELGKIKVIPGFKKIEDFETYDPTNCFAFWEIILATKIAIEKIKEVFLFIETTAHISIERLSENDLLQQNTISDYFNTLPVYNEEPVGLNQIMHFVSKNNFLDAGIITESAANQLAKPKQNPEINAELQQLVKKEKNLSSVRVSSDKLDDLMSIVSELVTTQASLTLYVENSKNSELEIITENVTKLSRRLRDVALGMTLIPIKHLMNRFQRLVRELSIDLNKEVELIIEGDETELDKNIIETLSDPIMHIIRNAMDHGIENAQERASKGKDPKGKIVFKAYYSGTNVHIKITDDGKGLNPDLIRNSAIKKGLIHEADVLSEKEIFELILQPGFSTASAVTDLSGRGVGMDVVKRNISNIRGEIEIASKLHKETSITIILPLTLSIIDGLLVKIEEESYIVPLSVVDKCYEVDAELLKNNFNKLLILEGIQIPFLNLREKFKLLSPLPDISQIIVVNNGDKKIGITVDSIVGEYQAVLKPLGKYYKNQDYISGATILGDGTVALVFDTNKIINQFSMALHEVNA